MDVRYVVAGLDNTDYRDGPDSCNTYEHLESKESCRFLYSLIHMPIAFDFVHYHTYIIYVKVYMFATSTL